ncbi:MAG: DUF6249 domain-containing protein [Bryobacteraceae bacterium]
MWIFLAAGAVALFAFLSVGAWAGAQSADRQTRDRYALLKTVAEQPGENAARVLEMLRQEDEERRLKKLRDERKGWIDGGFVLIAVGTGIGLMLQILSDESRIWSVGLIPFLLGVALVLIGFLRERGKAESK